MIVLVETNWVLKKRYGLPKVEILKFLNRLVSISNLHLERHQQIYEAINDWRKGSADFTDYVILAVSAADGCTSTYTFEKGKMGSDPRATTLSK